MRRLIARSSVALCAVSLCLWVAPVHAQRADSPSTVTIGEESAVIDLTNLVEGEDTTNADTADNAAKTQQDNSSDLAADTISASDIASEPQDETGINDETVIDEILAEIDEDSLVADNSQDAVEDDAQNIIEENNDEEAASFDEDTEPKDLTSLSDVQPEEAAESDTEAPIILNVEPRSEAGDNAEVSAVAPVVEGITENTGVVQPSARIGRKTLSNIGLVSIGLDDTNPSGKQLNSLIWQGSKADNIVALMSEAPAYGPSAEMNRLVLSALLRQAVPPQGAAQMADEMVHARLSWLAEAGRSDALAQLIRKLPGDDTWQDWQRWLVEYDLLTRNDADACRQVALAVGETLDPFWHQAQVVCQILSGDNLQAGFTADVVQASGLADDQFMQLVNLFLGRIDTANLDDTALTPLHLILMDAAHLDISQTQLSQLPVSLLQARSALRYLQRDAQLSMSYQALELGLADLETTAELLRSLYDSNESIIQAAARIGAEDETLNGLVRSNLYIQLAGSFARGRDVAEFDTLISEALRFEAALGGTELLMPLYAELIANRLKTEALPQIGADIAADFAIWQALAKPEDALPAAALAANPEAEAYRRLLEMGDDSWSAEVIEAAGGWDWLPLIEARGATQPDLDYQTLTMGLGNLPETASMPVHPFHMLALEKAAAEAGMGEVILRAAKALAGHDLAQIRSADLAQILTILSNVGLEDSAKIIAEESLRARMMDAYFAEKP